MTIMTNDSGIMRAERKTRKTLNRFHYIYKYIKWHILRRDNMKNDGVICHDCHDSNPKTILQIFGNYKISL